MKSKIIAIANQKGGVGKTTTALALSAGLAARKLRTLLIDMDGQANATLGAGVTNADGETSLIDVLTGDATAERTAKGTAFGADIIPANRKLFSADMMFTETGKEYRLREALTPVKGRYDMIIIDTPPAVGVLTVNALTAADGVIIPTAAEVFGIHGTLQIKNTIDAVKKYSNRKLSILGVLLTRTRATTNITGEMAELAARAAAELSTRLYTATIRDAVAIKEAQAARRPLFDTATGTGAAADYGAFIDEFLKQQGAQ